MDGPRPEPLEVTAGQSYAAGTSKNGAGQTEEEARSLLGAPQSHMDLQSTSRRLENTSLSVQRHSDPKPGWAASAETPNAIDRSITIMNVANLDDLQKSRRKSLSSFSFSQVSKLFSHRGKVDDVLFVPGVETYAAMHGTLFRRLVIFMLWWSILLVLVEIGLNASLVTSGTHSAIGFLQVDMDEECRSHVYWIMARSVEYGKYLVCYLICCMYFAGKLWKVAQLQYNQWRGFRDPNLEPGLWNAAASRDVFMETMTSISGAHSLSAVFIVFSVLCTSATMLAANLSSPELAEWADELCGEGMSICRASLFSAGALPNFNIGVLMWVFAVFVFTPLGFWTRVQVDAMKATEQYTMRRLLNLHWAMMPPMFSNFALFLQQCFTIRTFTATRLGAEIFFLGSLAVMAYSILMIGLLVWGMAVRRRGDKFDPDAESPNTALQASYFSDLPTGHREPPAGSPSLSLESFAALVAKIKNSSRDSARTLMGSDRSTRVTPAVSTESIAEDTTNVSNTGESGADYWYFRWGISSREGGCRLDQTVLAMCIVNLFCVSHMANSMTHFIVLWLLRLGYLLLLAMVRDPVASFKELAAGSGPGLGLVVDAPQLIRAIGAYLDGQEFTETIRTYKASLLRMQQTMAVSYRWQREKVFLAPNARPNMSRWQLEMLKQALDNSNARYVWIDTLSVIQRPGNLQQTLLARMMAVYSSAGTTLALRSLEEKHNRYHQRAWTLQEFCSARELRLATQENLDARSKKQVDTTTTKERSKPLVAYLEHEALITRRLRREMVNGSMAVSPFWLYGSQIVQNGDHVRELWHKFEMLSGILTCLKEPDKIRAVYPMLFLTTVESQEELVELADNVAEHTGGKTPAGLATLRAGLKPSRRELGGWSGRPSAEFVAPSAREPSDVLATRAAASRRSSHNTMTSLLGSMPSSTSPLPTQGTKSRFRLSTN